MRNVKLCITMLLLSFGALLATQKLRVVWALCVACHGEDGNSLVIALIPREKRIKVVEIPKDNKVFTRRHVG